MPILLLNAPTVNAKGDFLEPASDGKYYFRIVESQWEIRAYDMVKAQQIVNETGVDLDKAYEEVEAKGRVGPFPKGSTMVVTVVTTDVQHGFSINEVGVAIATIRPEPGEAFGAPTTAEFQWPNEDVTISAFCHIFCGLGHPDMKLKFVIGKGSIELGPPVFYAIVVLNVIIFAFVGNKILNKLE